MYGLLSYFTKLQTREIGIRMAFGATPAAIRRLVIGRGFGLALRGAGFGFLLSWMANRFLRSFLVGSNSISLATYIGVPLLLSVVTFVAGYFPIRRVLAGDPMASLRHE
jgi:ABC-type antimicrobial peptide transport system permease subunit